MLLSPFAHSGAHAIQHHKGNSPAFAAALLQSAIESDVVVGLAVGTQTTNTQHSLLRSLDQDYHN